MIRGIESLFFSWHYSSVAELPPPPEWLEGL